MFFVPADMACGTNHATGIRQQGWAHIKLGVACPLFSFLIQIHYKHNLDTYINHFHAIQESYPVRLRQNGSFSVPASMAHISSAQII